MGKTKDERFLIRLYEMASELGDPETPLNREAVGASIGLSPKASKTICALLAQGNFIRKHGPEEVFLTEQGIHLAKELRGGQ